MISPLGIGRTYDLDSLFQRLNRLYFDHSLQVTVRWSLRAVRKAKRRILLGTYHHSTKTITLSKRLDQPRVPLFFVEHILFHEMLHAAFPEERHPMHTEKFRRYEKMHPDYARAHLWEKENIDVLFKPPQLDLHFGPQAG